MERLFNQASFLRWECLLIVFVLLSDNQRNKATSENVIESNSDIQNLINDKIHFIPMFWDPSHKTVSVFNISDDSPLHIILSREKKGRCEMFYLRFMNNGWKQMIVCTAELHKNYLKEKCRWVNNTENVVVNEGNKGCGPWYLTIVVTNSTNTTEVDVEVSEEYDPLSFRWLRVLTNFAFIPGIIIALKRGLYAEFIVYFLNFVSSFTYHLCESELECFKEYDMLHYSDIYCSDLSIVVTVWTMTGIKEPLKHLIFLAIAIMLQFAVLKKTKDTYHFFLGLIFAGIPFCYLVFQYIYRNIKYKGCFPSRKRWLFNLIPGLMLATTGIVTNIIFSESDNYYYVHCIWHLTIMLSVAFLLPLKDVEDEWYLHEMEKSTYVPL